MLSLSAIRREIGQSVDCVIWKTGGNTKKHDIFVLLNQIKNMVEISDTFYDYADVLTPYGISVRYPNELYLKEHHAEKAVQMAKEFLDWVTDIVDSESSDESWRVQQNERKKN